MNTALKPSDIAKPADSLCHIDAGDLLPLPAPYEDFNQITIPPLNPEKIKNIETSLDDTVAIGIPRPATKEEADALVRKFLSGLKKLFEKPQSEGTSEENKEKALESDKEFIEFKGQREVHVRIEEIAAFEVLSLVLTPTQKETAKAE